MSEVSEMSDGAGNQNPYGFTPFTSFTLSLDVL